MFIIATVPQNVPLDDLYSCLIHWTCTHHVPWGGQIIQKQRGHLKPFYNNHRWTFITLYKRTRELIIFLHWQWINQIYTTELYEYWLQNNNNTPRQNNYNTEHIFNEITSTCLKNVFKFIQRTTILKLICVHSALACKSGAASTSQDLGASRSTGMVSTINFIIRDVIWNAFSRAIWVGFICIFCYGTCNEGITKT